ncbi:MAG TPA: GFA family protein [Rhizomicrobium sp.]|jgi:hypothetical protein|nr:GFA family protein [Rhizomicrobium sp.]
MTRNAACSCGALRIACEGEPVRISVCHCLECQRRTGSAFGFQAQFPRAQVTVTGQSSKFTRAGDSGNTATFSFCPQCGNTLYWEPQALPDRIYVAAGAFADPDFPAPRHSVYEERRHRWFEFSPGADIEHFD